jgi:uncharacterized protein (TIGR00255 family)
MNIYSMTGFGKAEAMGEKYSLNIELKSVNNRFKDFRFRMGGILSEYEINVRKELESHFKRGSFDVSIVYKRNPGFEKAFDIDEAKIKTFVDKVASMTDQPLSISPTEFLRSDFYVEEDDTEKKSELKGLLDGALKEACESLKESRLGEGTKLVEIVNNHIQKYEKFYDNIKELKNTYRDQIETRLKDRFDENMAKIKIDEPRFMQEVIYYLEKLDIDEEVNRIEIHLSKFKEIIKDGGEVGRKIDFLLQEFNRETNTIGSKSGHNDISDHVVEMKVQLEKIREQALNIE